MSIEVLPLQASVITIMTSKDGTYNARISSMDEVNVPQLIEILEKEIESLKFMISNSSSPISPQLEMAFSGKLKP